MGARSATVDSTAPGSTTRKWSGWFDRVVFGARGTSYGDRTWARLMVLSVALTIPFWLVFGLTWSSQAGLPAVVSNLVVVLVALLVVPAVRAGVDPKLVGQVYGAVVFLAILAFVVFVRGLDARVLAWQLVLPVGAVLFGTRSVAAIWALVFLLEVIALGAADGLGLLPTHPAATTGWSRFVELGNLVGVLLLLMLLAGIHQRAQRAAEMERQRLRQSVHRSERLANLGSLAASIGHEINNPIAYVISSLEHVRAGSDPHNASVREALDDAIDGAERVGRIAAQLNSFARVSGEPRPVRLAEVVHSALALAANELRHLGRIERSGEEDAWVLASDELSQVMLNLLINAVQAIRTSDAEPGSGCVRIIVKRDGPERVHLDVEDNGPGIPEGMRESVFEPFFTTKDVGEGTGLGLAISREMMEKLGGAIEVHPLEPRGTRFRLVLRATSAPERSSMRPLPAAGDDVLRVLVVDDEPALLRAFKRMLRGHAVTTASNGEQALELLNEGEFDLVLCDVMMPGMSGPELHRRVSGPIAESFVFVTGGAFDEAEAAYLERVGRPTLAKPVDPDSLLAVMETRRNSRASSSQLGIP